ncbi:MAG: glycosyltransferase family 2 protein [Chthoniobacteraceae bacterium]
MSESGSARVWPRISLVTPNYNYGHFIEATIRSVLDQDYANLEYIVLDDGSTDDSVETIRRYANRLAHWETGANRGQYATITQGFARCTGEIFGWLNSDDMHLPWTLRAVGDIFAHFPEIDWITSLHPGHWDRAGFLERFSRSMGFSLAAFLDGRNLPPAALLPRSVPSRNRELIQQESTFWRRSLWEKAGGNASQDFGSAGDFELWARFFRQAELIGIGIPLAGFRHQDQQQTVQAEKYARWCEKALAAYRDEVRWQPDSLRSAAHFVRSLPIPQPYAAPGLRAFGYTGRRVVRRDSSSADARWELEDYRFL